MARPIPPERFSQLVQVATATFINRGYRRTQMADVAEALGVAKGTLYGYVESKDALFDAALRFADQHEAYPRPGALPLKAPPPGETIRYVQRRVAAETAAMTLRQVVEGSLVIDDPKQEITRVLVDLYARLSHNRYTIKLIDRCAADYPELAETWYGQGRWAQHELLVRLIQQRIEDGSYREQQSIEVVARLLLESIAFWALHRHFDPSPQAVDDAAAERTVIEFLARGLLQEGA